MAESLGDNATSPTDLAVQVANSLWGDAWEEDDHFGVCIDAADRVVALSEAYWRTKISDEMKQYEQRMAKLHGRYSAPAAAAANCASIARGEGT